MKKTIDDILKGEKDIEDLENSIHEIEDKVDRGDMSEEDGLQERKYLRTRLSKRKKDVEALERRLGADEHSKNALDMVLRHKKYLTERLNAFNLLMRIRSKSQARRMEIDQIQRPHMREVNS